MVIVSVASALLNHRHLSLPIYGGMHTTKTGSPPKAGSWWLRRTRGRRALSSRVPRSGAGRLC